MERFRGIILALAVVLGSVGGVRVGLSAEVSAQASLSDNVAAVGESVELSITVRGAKGARTKDEIAVDGLNIQPMGQQTSVNIVNFNVDTTVTLTYQVTPMRAGEYEIPAVAVEAGGKTVRTEPIKFSVRDSGPAASGGGGASSGGASGQGGGFEKAGESGDLIFVELVPATEKGFVGQAIPVDVNIYVDARVRWQMSRPPEIAGDGFTVSKLAQKQPKIVSRDGRQYDQTTFTAILSPLKSGELVVGPIPVHLVAEIPQRRQRQRRMPGFPDSIFNDPFRDIFSMSIPQQVAASAPPVTLQIKPLPSQGKPPGFSGAVGRFSLSADASPARVKPGDPVTVKLKIEGQGNFDLVKVPEMEADPKWRAYPPSEKFEEQDGLGLRGEKRFDMALIPEAGAGGLPDFEFSYFDPTTERYETLKSGKLEVTVEQGAAPQQQVASAATPAATATGGTKATPTATPTPRIEPEDILYIRIDDRGWGESFEPIYRRPWFWIWQIVPAIGVLGLIVRRVAKGRAAKIDRVLAGYREEQERLAANLRGAAIERDRFLEQAVRWLRLEVASRTRCNPDSITRAEASALPGWTDEQRVAVGEVFGAWEELRFSGGGHGSGAVGETERARVNELVRGGGR
jgi:hypothetical protein